MLPNIDAANATALYGRSRPAIATGDAEGPRPFADAMAEAARSLSASLAEGESRAQATMSGEGDMRGLVEALSQAELALETAVTVRDRVVEAYQEILRMPV